MLIDPIDILSPSRLDVMCRIPYIENLILNLASSWGTSSYKNFILSTNPFKNFSEDNKKFDLKDYFFEFDKLINSIKIEGYKNDLPPIKIVDRGILTGAHRLAVALYLNIKNINVIDLTSQQVDFPKYGFNYLKSINLQKTLIKSSALNYCRFDKNVRYLILFDLKDDISRKIKSYFYKNSNLLFEEKIKINKNGQTYVTDLCYSLNKWWDKKYLSTMVGERFGQDESYIHYFIFHEKYDSESIEIKKLFRDTLSQDTFHRKIHSSDNYSESLYFIESALSSNFEHFLNNSSYFDALNVLERIKEYEDQYLPFKHYHWTISGSTILDLYGLKESRDIDFVYNEDFVSANMLKNFDSHNEFYNDNFISKDSLIYDPRKYFYFKGFKFINIHTYLYLSKKTSINLNARLVSSQKQTFFFKNYGIFSNNLSWILRYKIFRLIDQLILKSPRPISLLISRALEKYRLFKSIFL